MSYSEKIKLILLRSLNIVIGIMEEFKNMGVYIGIF